MRQSEGPIEIANKTVVVTGAALGIGRALVRDLASKGARVVALDVDATELEKTVALAGGSVEARVLDVSDRAAMEDLATALDPVSLLINNAATRIGQGHDAPIVDWQRSFEINIWGVVYGVQAFLPKMTHGAIVNVGSKQGITNPPGHPVYNMAKSAVKTYTEQLSHQLVTEGREVSAHLLIPGWTTTGHADHRPGAWLPEQVVERMWQGLEAGSFYIICPDDDVSEEMDKARIAWGAGDVIEDRPALSRWHPEWAAKAKAALEG